MGNLFLCVFNQLLITCQCVDMRQKLEENMQASNKLFPPGRVLWAMRDGNLQPSRQQPGTTDPSASNSGPLPRLFEVLDVLKVFSQIDLTGNLHIFRYLC